MSDLAFVKNAKAAWGRVLAMQATVPSDSRAIALAAALWASMNAEKLIEIAERKV